MTDYLEARKRVEAIVDHMIRRAEAMRQFSDQLADKADPYWKTAEADALNEEQNVIALRAILNPPRPTVEDVARTIRNAMWAHGEGVLGGSYTAQTGAVVDASNDAAEAVLALFTTPEGTET